MRRLIPVSIALAMAGTTLVAGSASTSASVAAAKPVRTDYGMTAASYGSRVIGGPLPADSSETGFISLSCTNKAGINNRNFVAAVNLEGIGTLRGVSSRVWTTKVGKTVNSFSSHDVAHLNIFSNDFGSLDINGISALSRTWHDAKGFHASTKTKVLSITYTPKGGKPQGLEVPTIGRPLTIPGLLRLAIGGAQRQVTGSGALANTTGIDLRLFPGTENQVHAIIGQTKSTIGNGIKSGLFSGASVGAEAKVLGNLVNIGRTPLQFMPCKGTGGKPLTMTTADVDLGPLVKASGLFAGMQGSQNRRTATGIGAAHVAELTIGDRITITGVRGVARVTRKDNKIVRSSEGTRVVEILVDGQPREILGDGLEIPGLAKLQSKIVTPTKHGLSVVALRITLLDGSLAVIDLGSVNLGIKGAGRRR